MRSAYPPQVRLYLAASRYFHKALAAANSLWVGVWLGLLDREALHSLDEACYSRWTVYQSAAHNRRGLMNWEAAMIQTYFGGCERLLVTGAGGGREVLALARLGFAVDGFECHPKLAALANQLLAQEGCDSRVELVPRDEGPQTGRRYDGLIVGWGAYMLIQGAAQRIAFLRSLRQRVEAGSPLLLSFYTRHKQTRALRMAARVANVLRRLRRKSLVEVGDSLEPNYVHYFCEDEMRSELQAAGFELVFYATEDYGHAVAMAAPAYVAGQPEVNAKRQEAAAAHVSL